MYSCSSSPCILPFVAFYFLRRARFGSNIAVLQCEELHCRGRGIFDLRARAKSTGECRWLLAF